MAFSFSVGSRKLSYVVGVVQAQGVSGDADVVRAVLAGLAVKRCQQNEEPREGSKYGHWQITECAPPQLRVRQI